MTTSPSRAEVRRAWKCESCGSVDNSFTLDRICRSYLYCQEAGFSDAGARVVMYLAIVLTKSAFVVGCQP
jgi:hypothetical protein